MHSKVDSSITYALVRKFLKVPEAPLKTSSFAIPDGCVAMLCSTVSNFFLSSSPFKFRGNNKLQRAVSCVRACWFAFWGQKSISFSFKIYRPHHEVTTRHIIWLRMKVSTYRSKYLRVCVTSSCRSGNRWWSSSLGVLHMATRHHGKTRRKVVPVLITYKMCGGVEM